MSGSDNASSNKIRLIIDKLPIMVKQFQTIDIESMIINPVVAPNISIDFDIPGEKMEYGNLDIGYLVDKNWNSYVEAFNFMQSMVPDQTLQEQREMHTTDITVQMMDNQYNNIIRTFNFQDAWITSLSPLPLDITASDPIINIATFIYTKMTITPTNPNIGNVVPTVAHDYAAEYSRDQPFDS